MSYNDNLLYSKRQKKAHTTVKTIPESFKEPTYEPIQDKVILDKTEKVILRKTVIVYDGDAVIIKPESHMIKCMCYLKNKNQLLVQFLPNDKVIYRYHKVPIEILNELLLTESKGTCWNKHKRNFEFTKDQFKDEWGKY